MSPDWRVRWQELYREHVIPKPDSAADLVLALRTKPERLKEQTWQDVLTGDSSLARRVTDAAKVKLFHLPLTVTRCALFAFRDLAGELGHRPDRNQVRRRVEKILGKKLDDRVWRRTLHDDGIESLFRADTVSRKRVR